MRPIRRPSHRNPDSPQPEACDICGTLVSRLDLVPLEIEGLRGNVSCPHCLNGSLKQPSFRDHRANQGRRPQQLPHRLPPYGASTWIEEE